MSMWSSKEAVRSWRCWALKTGAQRQFRAIWKMEEAYHGSEKYPFKILMSHDPSHWDAEVTKDYMVSHLTLAVIPMECSSDLNCPGLNGALYSMCISNGLDYMSRGPKIVCEPRVWISRLSGEG